MHGWISFIPLSQGKYTIVDTEDVERICRWKWCYGDGYAIRSGWRNGKTYPIKMHRVIVDAPTGLEVDHINRNKLDNRKSNLRLCTDRQQAINRPVRSDNKCGYKGVHYSKVSRVWMSDIRIRGKLMHLGNFDNPVDAAKAYNEAAKHYYGEFAYLNPV